MAQIKSIQKEFGSKTFIKKDILLSHLRSLQLQTRLLLLASSFDGFQLQSQDVQVLCSFLLEYIDRVQNTLKEV